jgi:hypothetical protein
MLSKLWEKIGEGIVQRWLVTTYGPALLFFAGGVLAYAGGHDIGCLVQAWNGKTAVTQGAALIVTLFLVLFIANIVEDIQGWVIKLAEGYTPAFLDDLRVRLSRRWYAKIQKKMETLQSLVNAPNQTDRIRKNRLDAEIAHLPLDESHAMPTLLGNLLRASEDYPRVRYGLDAMVCWPRLYPLLSDTLRQSIDSARGKLNESARLLTWSILFWIWLVWSWWWALLSLPIAWIAYRGMISAVGVYGDLLRTAFDLHRFDLYQSLRWDLPPGPENEKIHGEELTVYLFRGFAPQDQLFKHPDEET